MSGKSRDVMAVMECRVRGRWARRLAFALLHVAIALATWLLGQVAFETRLRDSGLAWYDDGARLRLHVDIRTDWTDADG